MSHDTPLISTLAIGLVLAFAFGILATRLRLPPIAGYLLAGVAAGPFTPGFVADPELSKELKAMHTAGPAAVAGLQRLKDVVEVGERTDQFINRARSGQITGRIRVIGEEGAEIAEALGATSAVTVLTGPVLATGRRELLTFLREQAISRTRHRYGHVDASLDPLPARA